LTIVQTTTEFNARW